MGASTGVSSTSVPAAVPAIVEDAFQRHRAAALLDELRRLPATYYLVGGAVRDGFIGSTPSDLDIVVPNGDVVVHEILRHFGPGVQNRHGNWRYGLPTGGHVDLIEPQRFYQPFSGIVPMLRFFDASVNALAVDLRSNQVLDPIGGLDDLTHGRVTLPVDRWTSMNDFESVHLALRAVRLLQRYPLAITNPEVLAAQMPKVDLVDWSDLHRLHKIDRACARTLLSDVCARTLAA
jgi:hypothetical protein